MQDRTLRLDRFAWVVMAVALLLRVVIMLTLFNSAESFTGDGPFYIKNAVEPWRLTVQPPDWPYDDTSAYTTSIGPVYPVFLIPFYNLIPASQPVTQALAARMAQAVLDTLIVLFVCLITRRLFGQRAGRVALVAQALDLRYMFTAGTIATETLFLTLFTGMMVIYLRTVVPPDEEAPLRRFRWAGLLLGLAILTRPVPLLFPVVMLAHLWLLVYAPGGSRAARRQYLRGLGWMVGVAALLVVPWMARTAYVKGEFVPVSDTGAVHFWRAARDDGAEISTDEAHAQAAAEDTGYDLTAPAASVHSEQYVEAGVERISRNPLAWLRRITRETVASILQPYGTVIATPRGAGVRQVAASWLRGEATLGDVLTVPGMWRRLLMYVWHYWTLIGGAAGLALAVRRGAWWQAFPLAGWALYVVAVAAVLLVEPRYIFPAMFALTPFAAYASVEAWDWLAARENAPRWLRRSQADPAQSS